MNSNIGIIISREFRERVVKKSFIITTLLSPVIMILMMMAPALIMELSSPSEKTMAVIDKSGIIFPELVQNQKELEYLKPMAVAGSPDSIFADEQYDIILSIPADVVERPQEVTLYTRDAGSIEIESTLNSLLKHVVERERLKEYNIENLQEIMDKVSVTSQIKTLRIDEDGNGESVSTAISVAMGFVMTFILYMFLLMYGQMVMTSIIEEKNNRVLELIVSSVKPLHLMLGKIIGVGLVALVQIAIWAILICTVSGVLMPLLMPEGMSEQVAMMNAGTFDAATSRFDPDMVRAMATFSSVAYVAKMFLYMTLFLIGGFLFYASIFAAIGSAVDNVQDASQLQTFAILPIILALVFSLSVGTDPNGTLAVWMSMIPFTSPMVMLARIPFDIAGWEVWVSLAILYVSFAGMAWIAAKIYRVGIFMYGKKPSIKDLVRWARYK